MPLVRDRGLDPGEQWAERPRRPTPAPTVVVAADDDEEARAAVRRIAGWFADGTPLHRMAVLHPAGVQHALLLHQHFDAAELPVNGPDHLLLRDALAPRVLLDLLRLPDRDFGRDEGGPTYGVTGTVKWFDQVRGFGFVTPDDGGQDVFLHSSVLQRAGKQDVQQGEKVSLEVRDGQRGRQAVVLKD